MPRSRVPIRGSIGKSILTGQKSTVVQQTIVQQVVKGSTSGVGAVAATIWPLISQIPINVSDLAALTTAGIVVDTGSHIIARTLAVNTPLTIANPTGAGGNPTISLTTAALTKTDDTNVTVTLGGTPGSALVAATSLTLGWTGQLAVPRGGSGAATLTGYLKGNGTSPFTANATIPATDITGLATVATTGAYSDLSGTPTIPADISGLTYVTGSDETADAPNSLQLIAGTNVTFDTSTPNQLKIDATGGGSSPLTTKGDLFGYDTADARIPVGADGKVLTADSGAALGVSWQTVSGTGTVTSVDVTVPSILTISGNPITTSGTLAFDLATQNANLVLAGPTTGSPAKPTFRALVIADIPTIPAAHTSGFATVATTGAYSDLSGLPGSALTKTDDTNVTLTLGGSPTTALLAAASITMGWTGTLAVARGGSGAGTLTGYLKGNGTSAFTANATIPTTDITGLAAIATSGSATDLTTGTVPSARLPTASTSVLGAVKVDGTSITISGGVISSTGGGGTGANPTAVVGLTAVNGTATTFLRSDGAPALDQSIAPTWTGAHNFTGGLIRSTSVLGASIGADGATFPAVAWNNPAGGTDSKIWEVYTTSNTWHLQTVNDALTTGADAMVVARSGNSISGISLGNATDNPPITVNGALTVTGRTLGTGNNGLNGGVSGFSFGVDSGLPSSMHTYSPAGTDAKIWETYTDASVMHFRCVNDAFNAATDWLTVSRSGTTPIAIVFTAATSISGFGPSFGGSVDMTPDKSTFTGTLTGMTTTVNNTCAWSRNGNQVTLFVGAATGTSNANTFTMTGLPAAIQPARTQLIALAFNSLENLGAVIGSTESMQVNASSGTVTFLLNGNSATWGTSGTKGVVTGFTVTYLLN